MNILNCKKLDIAISKLSMNGFASLEELQEFLNGWKKVSEDIKNHEEIVLQTTDSYDIEFDEEGKLKDGNIKEASKILKPLFLQDYTYEPFLKEEQLLLMLNSNLSAGDVKFLKDTITYNP